MRATIGPRSVAEGAVLEFVVMSYDLDGTVSVLSASPLPANATFQDSLNGDGLFHFQPDFTQEGIYNVTFRAFDGIATDSEQVQISVVTSNQPPVIAPISNQYVTEGGTLIFLVHATDPDGTVPALTAVNLLVNSTFADSAYVTGLFLYTPDYMQSGVNIVTFIASDGIDSDTINVQITTYDAGNQRPVLAPIGPYSVNEGQTLQFGVTATDPDGNWPMLGAIHMPLNASIVDFNNGTGSFTQRCSHRDRRLLGRVMGSTFCSSGTSS